MFVGLLPVGGGEELERLYRFFNIALKFDEALVLFPAASLLVLRQMNEFILLRESFLIIFYIFGYMICILYPFL